MGLPARQGLGQGGHQFNNLADQRRHKHEYKAADSGKEGDQQQHDRQKTGYVKPGLQKLHYRIQHQRQDSCQCQSQQQVIKHIQHPDQRPYNQSGQPR